MGYNNDVVEGGGGAEAKSHPVFTHILQYENSFYQTSDPCLPVNPRHVILDDTPAG